MNKLKPSDIIKNKLLEQGGEAKVYGINKKCYTFYINSDESSFSSDSLPFVDYEFTVFDIIVDLVVEQGGKAKKGCGRNSKLGYGKCTEDTVVGAIGKRYFKKSIGQSVYDPVFIMAAILEWADICKNNRGFITINPIYNLYLNSK